MLPEIFRKEANRNLLQQARLVVVASAIPVETCKKVASVPGPKTANLIFTLDRKQKYFGAFFKEPFERMCYGQEMLFACVQIAPQGPLQRDDIPAKVLIAEAGKLTRAQSSPWLLQIGFEKLVGDDPRRDGLASITQARPVKPPELARPLSFSHLLSGNPVFGPRRRSDANVAVRKTRRYGARWRDDDGGGCNGPADGDRHSCTLGRRESPKSSTSRMWLLKASYDPPFGYSADQTRQSAL